MKTASCLSSLSSYLWSCFVGCFMTGIVAAVCGCAHRAVRPEAVYQRAGATRIKSVVAMPVTDLRGTQSEAAQQIKSAVISGWAQTFGPRKVMRAGAVVEELNIQLAEAYEEILRSIRNPKKTAQLKADPRLSRYRTMFLNELGDHDLAFAVMDGERSQFESKKPIYLYLGVFDTKSMTWKWVTRTEGRKGLFVPWESASNELVSEGFESAPVPKRSVQR